MIPPFFVSMTIFAILLSSGYINLQKGDRG